MFMIKIPETSIFHFRLAFYSQFLNETKFFTDCDTINGVNKSNDFWTPLFRLRRPLVAELDLRRYLYLSFAIAQITNAGL
jgi:hypothetical protein